MPYLLGSQFRFFMCLNPDIHPTQSSDSNSYELGLDSIKSSRDIFDFLFDLLEFASFCL